MGRFLSIYFRLRFVVLRVAVEVVYQICTHLDTGMKATYRLRLHSFRVRCE